MTVINHSFNYLQFALDIANERGVAGISLRELAKQTNVSFTTVYRAEAGANMLDIESVIRICNWLKKPVQDYLKPIKTKSNANKNKSKNH